MDTIPQEWSCNDDTCFPIGFFDIGGKTFAWVYENKREFSDSVIYMRKTTGLYKSFQNYVIRREASKIPNIRT